MYHFPRSTIHPCLHGNLEIELRPNFTPRLHRRILGLILDPLYMAKLSCYTLFLNQPAIGVRPVDQQIVLP